VLTSSLFGLTYLVHRQTVPPNRSAGTHRDPLKSHTKFSPRSFLREPPNRLAFMRAPATLVNVSWGCFFRTPNGLDFAWPMVLFFHSVPIAPATREISEQALHYGLL